jgi:HPt (histidine-containing phosphotransfer) domain-containing protein
MSDSGSDPLQTQLDAGVLEQLAHDIDASLLPTVLAMFLADGHKLFEEIEFALASGDDDALAKAAHKLGGNTATCGQTRLSQTLYDCENFIRGGDITKGRAQAKQFLKLAPSGFESLSNYLENLTK